ncbi:MAG: dephospho-CoA kinase [Alphaproteobacteria bacterium]|nr:dephospho-CoA kinase [Alphaproteobacteria bacterium]
MLVLGLTGSIGMGKSTVADMLRELGFPVFSSDAFIHKALDRDGKAVPTVASLFPETYRDGAIDRVLLGALVFSDPEKLQRLEGVLHPLVRKAETAFIQEARKKNARAAVLEIPLLFETKAETMCDFVLCVSAPLRIQRARVLRRRNMTEKKLQAIRARQRPESEKKRRSDIIIPTGGSVAQTRHALFAKLASLGLVDPRPTKRDL